MCGTGGQVNRMSDDLISRKALLDRFRYGDKEFESDKAWICAVRRMIKEQPTAFDKEKVIEKIKDESSSERFEDVGISGNVYGHYFKEVIDTEEAIEIVEKGGIE